MLTQIIFLCLVSLLLGVDPKKPHPHTGIIDPFQPGPPPALSSSEAAGLNAGKPVQKSVEMPNGTGGRALAVFDIPAPPDVVWDCINDIKNYPKMVPGVAETQIYDTGSLRGGGTMTRAKYTLALLGYRISYYLDLKYEPRLNSMTFRLDYTRLSDIDDTTGYWHVAPIAGPGGECTGGKRAAACGCDGVTSWHSDQTSAPPQCRQPGTPALIPPLLTALVPHQASSTRACRTWQR